MPVAAALPPSATSKHPPCWTTASQNAAFYVSRQPPHVASKTWIHLAGTVATTPEPHATAAPVTIQIPSPPRRKPPLHPPPETWANLQHLQCRSATTTALASTSWQVHVASPLVAPLSFKPLLLVLSLLHNLEKKKAIFYLRKKEGANGLCSRMVEE